MTNPSRFARTQARLGPATREVRRVRVRNFLLVLPRREDVVVNRFDNFHRPHLIDRGVEEQDEEVERDDRAEESHCAAEDGIEGSIHGGEGDEGVKRQADKKAEVDLILAPSQELIVNRVGEGARRLLHRDKQERDRNRRHRDDAGSDRPEQVARCLRVGKDVALQQLPRRFQPGKTRPVEKVRTDGEEEKSD